MDSTKRDSPAARNQSSLRVVWLALLLAMFAYTAVAFVFSSPEVPEVKKNVKAAFVLGGAVLALISLLVFRFSLSDASLRKKYLAAREKEPRETLDELSGRLLIPHVVPWGINETVVLLGFVLAFLGKNPPDAIPFSAAGIVLQLCMYPRVRELLERAENQG